MDFGAPRLAAAIARLDPTGSATGFCVALSGGLDSCVVLHAMAALRVAPGARALRAVHIDHGLQPESAAWAENCRALCRRLDVPFEAVTLALAPARGASIEAEARDARYAALAARLHAGEWLLTAHHRDDQLETVLIQLLRGAGVAGLAAMPELARLGRGWHARPLLGVDRAALAAYAGRHALDWVRDPMNDSTRFDRGWLRVHVLPAMRQRWPAAGATVARSAGHLAEARHLLDELAESDGAGIVDGGRVAIAGLQRLSRERQANLLRWWIRSRGLGAPPAARLAAALRELPGARADAKPLVRWPDGELRRHRGRLYAMHPLPSLPALPGGQDATSAVLDLGPGLGKFNLVAGMQGGLRLPLAAGPVIRFRAGGESLRTHADRPRKRLKDLCREAGIVPWMRERLPLVFVGERLAAVGDLWVEAELSAPAGVPALKPVWSDRPELD
ncbi:MAG TPA: tRNA lysidine(34) synthetase TilS [Steroidobacteraceae bacterium]